MVNDCMFSSPLTEEMTEVWFSLKLTQGETSGDFEFSIFIDETKVYSTINTKPEVRVSEPDFFLFSEIFLPIS